MTEVCMATSFRTYYTRLGAEPTAVRDAWRNLEILGISLLHYPETSVQDFYGTLVERMKYDTSRHNRDSHHVTPNFAGFHCSWCFGPDDFRDKLASMTPGDDAYKNERFKSQVWNDSRIAKMHLDGTWLDGTKHGENIC